MSLKKKLITSIATTIGLASALTGFSTDFHNRFYDITARQVYFLPNDDVVTPRITISAFMGNTYNLEVKRTRNGFDEYIIMQDLFKQDGLIDKVIVTDKDGHKEYKLSNKEDKVIISKYQKEFNKYISEIESKLQKERQNYFKSP